MTEAEFRRQLLAAIHDAKASHPDAHLYLLYAPELADPLQLADEARRTQALIRPMGVEQAWLGETAQLPRVITLDCRRVASYLLESDPGLDDPLFEASVTLAHAEVCLGMRVDTTLTNDDAGHAEGAICGWIVSEESAATIAQRIGSQSRANHPGHRGEWVRWYNPIHLDAVWRSLSAEQRHSLIGHATWLAHDAAARLTAYRAADHDAPERADTSPSARLLDRDQWQALDNAVLVAALARSWQGLCDAEGRTLPADATDQLHRHALAAQRHGLDAQDLALYTMTAVQLPAGATQAPEFLQLVEQVVTRGSDLGDGLRNLPDTFWQRYQPISSTDEHTAQA